MFSSHCSSFSVTVKIRPCISLQELNSKSNELKWIWPTYFHFYFFYCSYINSCFLSLYLKWKHLYLNLNTVTVWLLKCGHPRSIKPPPQSIRHKSWSALTVAFDDNHSHGHEYVLRIENDVNNFSVLKEDILCLSQFGQHALEGFNAESVDMVHFVCTSDFGLRTWKIQVQLPVSHDTTLLIWLLILHHIIHHVKSLSPTQSLNLRRHGNAAPCLICPPSHSIY